MTKATSASAQNSAQVETVTVTIDGFSMQVPKGTLIIRAAEEVGIQIPRFCDHPLLEPVGACRQCIVEVEGQRKPLTACTTTVAEGMVIRSQMTSPVAEKAQRGTMELLLINHPLDCPVCDKGGECPLQNQAMSNGAADSRFRDKKRTFQKPIAISSQVLLDRERCVLCARCTRFSQEIAGDPFIDLFERGALEQVAIYEDEPFQSYFSGNTVQICPVGALTGTQYRFRARPFDLQSTESVCEHCASGCAQRTDWRRGKVTRRLASDDPAVNEEWNCDKGRWAFQYAAASDRILTPLIRNDDGDLIESSWPEALEFAARGLQAARDSGGVGVLPGGRLTTEDAYAYAKFARVVLGTNDIDVRVRSHSAEELDFLAARVAGSTPHSGAVTYADLETAPAVLLVAFEPEEESPIVFLRLRKATRKNGVRVFSVAPLRTASSRKLSSTLIMAEPGEEAVVLKELAAQPATGSHAEAARVLHTPGAVILVGERLAAVPGGLSAVAALAAATGARLAWVPRRAGERGAIDVGALPTALPGGRLVSNVDDRAAVEELWGVNVPSSPGRDTAQILSAVREGHLKGLLVGGVDPFDLPDPRLALEALDTAGFVVSLELRPSAVTNKANVVLPVAPVVEKSGSYVNWEGRHRAFTTALQGTGAMPDLRVLHALAEEFDIDLRLSTVERTQSELRELGSRTGPKADDPNYDAVSSDAPHPGQARLATWHWLLDEGALQVHEPYLAGTRKTPRVHLSDGTANEIGVREGDLVTVRTDRGSITLPLVVTDMPERVVWLPTQSPGSNVRGTLGADYGSVVLLEPGGTT